MCGPEMQTRQQTRTATNSWSKSDIHHNENKYTPYFVSASLTMSSRAFVPSLCPRDRRSRLRPLRSIYLVPSSGVVQTVGVGDCQGYSRVYQTWTIIRVHTLLSANAIKQALDLRFPAHLNRVTSPLVMITRVVPREGLKKRGAMRKQVKAVPKWRSHVCTLEAAATGRVSGLHAAVVLHILFDGAGERGRERQARYVSLFLTISPERTCRESATMTVGKVNTHLQITRVWTTFRAYRPQSKDAMCRGSASPQARELQHGNTPPLRRRHSHSPCDQGRGKEWDKELWPIS